MVRLPAALGEVREREVEVVEASLERPGLSWWWVVWEEMVGSVAIMVGSVATMVGSVATMVGSVANSTNTCCWAASTWA